jgi:hypothetical protein
MIKGLRGGSRNLNFIGLMTTIGVFFQRKLKQKPDLLPAQGSNARLKIPPRKRTAFPRALPRS